MAFDPNKPFEVIEEDVVGFDPNLPFEEVTDEGTSFAKEIQQIGPAFMESLGRPLESMGETAEVFGFTDIAEGLKGAIQEPENYESAAARFAEPKPEDASFVGFAWQYAPRAIAEQTGQIGLTIGGSIAGRAAGIPFGPVGTAAGSFLGPAIIEAAQIIGPVAKERAANNGREKPNQSDIAGAILTAAGSGVLNAIGARYLPGGEKATGKFFKRLATSFIGEAPTETGSAFVEQIGGTAFTEKGLEVSPKQAIAEGIIGGGSGAAITAISAPLHREPKEKKIVTEEEAEEQDIEGQSNIEAINLTAPAGDIQTKKDVSRIAELEKVKAENELLSQALEPNEPEAKRLDLENTAIDKEITRLQGGVIESAGLTPINQAERDAVAASKEETPTSIATRIEQTKVAMAGLEPTSRRYTELQDQLTADEGKLVEQQQAELAQAIAEEPAAQLAEVAPEVAPTAEVVTPTAQVAEQVAPPTEQVAAPTEVVTPEVAPVSEPITPAEPVVTEREEAAPDIQKSYNELVEEGTISPKEFGERLGLSEDQVTDALLATSSKKPSTPYNDLISEIRSDIVSRIEGLKKDVTVGAKGKKSAETRTKWQSALNTLDAVEKDFLDPFSPRVKASRAFADMPAIIEKTYAKRFEGVATGDAARQQQIKARTRLNADALLKEAGVPTPTETAAEPTISEKPQTSELIGAPTGIAVGNRIKLGRSPQTYTVEEVIPQTETEKELGEQYYSVKNEKTGEVQTVEAKDLKVVKGKGARKMAAQTQDSRFAELERRAKAGDKEAQAEAQRMVDEAAKAAGYVLNGFHGSPEKNITQFKNPTWIAKSEYLSEMYSEEFKGDELVTGRVYPVIINPGNTLKLWRFKDWVDLVEKLAPNNDNLKNQILKSQSNDAFGIPLFQFDDPDRREKISKWAKENRTWDNFKKTTLEKRAIAKRLGEEYFAWNTEGYDLSSTWREGFDQSTANFSNQMNLVNALFDLGYDTLGQLESGRNASTDAGYLVKNPSQIKSADPFTYDDAGNLIPLSERFQPTTPDIRRMADIRVTEDVVKPVPKERQYSFEDIEKRVKKYFGGTIPEGVVIVNDTTEDYQFKGAYIIDNGQLIINQAYIDRKESIFDIISHELGHFMYGDPAFQAAFKNFWNALTSEERAEIDRIINEFYNKDTGEVQLEERRVMAFEQLIENSKARSAWRKFLDAIGNWINKTFGTNIKTTDAGAMAVLAAGHKRFKSGEKIIREMDAGTMRMAARPEEGIDEQEMARYDKKSQVAGIKNIGSVIDTPKGIKKTTEKIIKDRFINVDEVSEANTAKAWNLIGKLQKSNPESGNTVSAINELVRETIQDTEADDVVKQTIGGAIMRNELYKYAIKLTAQGDNKMLNYLLNNRLAIASGAIDEGDAGRLLNALANLKNWIVRASDSEQSAFIQIAASRFFDTKTPTDEQIKQIKAMFDAVKTTKIDQEKELSAELEEVGKATGIDVADRVTKEVAKGAKAKAESEADILSKEYYSIQSQAEAQIERLAKIQSDTPSFAKGKRDEIKKIVNDDLKNTPDMGRKDAWKSMLTAKLKDAGVNETDASLLSELVWRQHEINDTNRKMDETVKAVEKGAIKGIVDAILNTPLSEQQKPEWRREVIKKYLIDAGVASSKADNIAKLFDISLQKRFAEAQVKAAEKAMKGIGGKLTPESKRAFQAFIKAIRAQVVNPGTDAAKEFGKQMGWKGFTPDQITKINEYDSIIESDTTTDAEKYVAIKKIQDIVSSVSLPPTALSAFSSFYVGNALGRITTASIQVVDPALYAAFDTAVDAVRMAATNPAQVPFAIYNYFASLNRMMKEIAFSFRNDVNRSGKMVDYLDNNDAKITRVFQDGQRLWKQGKYKEGLKKMLFGYPTITFRTLKALDDGSFSLLREAAITRYVSAAMDMAKIPKKNQRGVIRGLMQGRETDIKQMMNQGLSKTDATVYANDRMMIEITKTLSGLNIEPQDTINSIINDSLSRLGKTRFIEDITGEGKEIKDEGTLSYPFLKLYETTSRAISNIKGPGGEAMRVLQRVLFGFPLIPARMFNIAAGYTPLTLYRHFLTGRYPLTYGTAMQRKQRLIEQMSGVIALAPFLLLRSMSLDDEDKEGVRVYFTGQGPLKSQDKTLNQQWNRSHKPYSMEVWIGDRKVALDAKASGPLGVLIYALGAIDDWQIRNRLRNDKITEDDWRSAEEKLNLFTSMYELAGSFVLTTARRGPTTGVMQGIVDFRRYPDDPIASIGSELSFSAVPAVPVLGMGVVKNISDLLSEPIDTTTIKGALLNNIPIVGPLATKPAINTFGQKVGELQVSEKLKKATGIPFTLTSYSNPEEQKLADITLKYGDGPEPIKRSWLEDQFESMITDEEWYAGAEAFGKANRQMVLEDYDYLNDLTNEEYRDEMKAIAKAAREEAYDAVDKLRSKKP